MDQNKQIIVLGSGKNQIKHINLLKKNGFQIIVIDKYKKDFKQVNLHIKHSLYQQDIKKIKKKLTKLKINNIIYRSSGPTILLAHNLENFFKIERIDKHLAKSIYSKSYFSTFLKKNNFPYLKQKTIKKFKNINFKKIKVLKPDSSILGKKHVFINNSFNYNNYSKCKNNSHNKKVILSEYVQGRDINSFFIVNKKKKIFVRANFEEVNSISNNTIKNSKILIPIKNINVNILEKINNIALKIIKKFIRYYGAISITSKLDSNNKIFPYEINIGLSGDNFADKYYPNVYKKNLYKSELKILLNKHIN